MSKRSYSIVLSILVLRFLSRATEIARPDVGIHDGRPAQVSLVPLDAEMSIRTDVNGKVSLIEGHFYRNSHGQSREDRGKVSVITDSTAGRVTILDHDRKEKRVHLLAKDPTRPQNPPTTKDGSGDQQAQRLRSSYRITGVDTLEDHPIQKVLITPLPEYASKVQQVEVWLATDLKIQVYLRSSSPDRVTTKALTNIKQREPNASLFLVPSDYQDAASETSAR